MAQGKTIGVYRGAVEYKWTPGGWYKREFGLALHLINLSYSCNLVFLPPPLRQASFHLSPFPIRLYRRVLKDSPGSELLSPSAPASQRARFCQGKILAMIRPIFHSRLPSKETLCAFSAHEHHSLVNNEKRDWNISKKKRQRK